MNSALFNCVQNGWVIKHEDKTYTIGDLSTFSHREYKYTGQTEREIADCINMHGPSTLTELADEIGMYPTSLRVHVDRICVKVGTAPDKRSALYGLKDGWKEEIGDVQAL